MSYKAYYEFRGTVWNDQEMNEEIVRGVVYAANEPEAMEKIYAMYGDDIVDMTIAHTGFDQTGDPVYEFSNEDSCLFTEVTAKDKT